MASQNAWASFMLGSQQRQKKRKASVLNDASKYGSPCPMGCGLKLFPSQVYVHTNRCKGPKQRQLQQQQQQAPRRKPHGPRVKCPCCTRELPEDFLNMHLDQCLKAKVLTQDEKINAAPPKIVSPEPASSTASVSGTVFEEMMTKSKVLHTTTSASSHCGFTFHLNSDLSIRLERNENPALDVAWQSLVKIRNGASVVPISLSSGLESATSTPKRLVKFHSKFSISALKSMLQKNIRRRRPLPAVRVAMELFDRSPGELLRRLPIIVLEDCCLHPDYDFLVWCMMAYSKDFELHSDMIRKVMRIVVELGFCPWQDDGADATSRFDHEATPLTLESLSDEWSGDSVAASASKEESLVFSMLLRRHYGGMECDLVMLLRFAAIWKQRFLRGKLPPELNGRYKDCTSWLTFLQHSRAKVAAKQTTKVLSVQLPRLLFADCCIQGIDFHCSNIVDDLVDSDKKRAALARDLFLMAGDKKDNVKASLKSMMWNCSSGVNYRRRLLSNSAPVTPMHNHLWTEVFEAAVTSYQTIFVKERLSYG